MSRHVERVFVLSVPVGRLLTTVGVFITPDAAIAQATVIDKDLARELPSVWTWADGSDDVQQGFAKGSPDSVRWVLEPWALLR